VVIFYRAQNINNIAACASIRSESLQLNRFGRGSFVCPKSAHSPAIVSALERGANTPKKVNGMPVAIRRVLDQQRHEFLFGGEGAFCRSPTYTRSEFDRVFNPPVRSKISFQL